MSSSGVVSIRVEALGVSITIADGSIAIEQTPTVNAARKVKRGAAAASERALPLGADDRAPAIAGPLREDAVLDRRALPESPGDSTTGLRPGALPRNSGVAVSAMVRGNSDTAVIDELEQTPHQSSSPDSNGSLRRGSGEGQEARSGQTKPVWSDEEVEKLRALYPTHSASAIAMQLGRGRNAVRSKAQNLGLKKTAPPTVTSKPVKPAPKPRSLSAAVTEDPAPMPSGFGAVTLLDHHSGQCRWMSEVWPVMYCGAPVVDSSSWCEQHSKRVFNVRSQALGARFRLKAWC
jgi:hypothetical protein